MLCDLCDLCILCILCILCVLCVLCVLYVLYVLCVRNSVPSAAGFLITNSYPCLDAAADIVVGVQPCPAGCAGLHNVVQNSVGRIFVKNADFSEMIDVIFETFEFQAVFVRVVGEVQNSEVGQAGFWAYCRELRYLHVDSIIFIRIDIAEHFYRRHLQITDVILPAFVISGFCHGKRKPGREPPGRNFDLILLSYRRQLRGRPDRFFL